MKKRRLAALLGLTLVVGGLGIPTAAADDPPEETRPDFQMPFSCGETWALFTYADHSGPGNDYPEQVQQRIDMQNHAGTEGSAVLASAAGTVHHTNNTDIGGINMEHADGWWSQYLHMRDRVADGTQVEAGDRIGTASNTGTNDAHLHYQQMYDFDGNGYPTEGGQGGPPELVDPVIEGELYQITPDTPVARERTQGCDGGDPGEPEPGDTTLSYTGDTEVRGGADVQLSAVLADSSGSGVSGRELAFELGDDASCTGETGSDGSASCTVDGGEITPPEDGVVPLTVTFDGDDDYAGISIDEELEYVPEETTLTYTGVENIANGSPAELSAELTDTSDAGVADRDVDFAIGTDGAAQTCTGTTDADGIATCTVDDVDQPLTDDATVPLAASFAGDARYQASDAEADLDLEYVQGNAFGLSADVSLVLLPVTIDPVPDTGQVRAAHAESFAPDCAETIDAVVLSAGVLCAGVETRTGPTSATSTATVSDISIGLPGLPAVEISGLTAESSSSCSASEGSVNLELTVAGTQIEVPDTPGHEVDLGLLGKLVINEQVPVDGADKGLTVNGVHLTAPGADVVIGSATSSAHNCA